MHTARNLLQVPESRLSYAAGLQKLTEVAWKTVPSTYIICESDKAIPPSLQELFARRAERVHRLSTSHSPFVSQPAALAQLIREELASTQPRELLWPTQCAKWRAPVT